MTNYNISKNEKIQKRNFLIELIKDDYKLNEIIKLTGLSQTTVLKWSSEENLTIRTTKNLYCSYCGILYKFDGSYPHRVTKTCSTYCMINFRLKKSHENTLTINRIHLSNAKFVLIEQKI